MQIFHCDLDVQLVQAHVMSGSTGENNYKGGSRRKKVSSKCEPEDW